LTNPLARILPAIRIGDPWHFTEGSATEVTEMIATITLEWLATEEETASGGGEEVVRLRTDDGTINCRFHPAPATPAGSAAVIWVGGAGGGLFGPAGGMYPRLAEALVPRGIASLRLDYRYPNKLLPCVLDVLLGIAWLGERGLGRVALVGHSFGGAVVIAAGEESPEVVGVAALSSQTHGTGTVSQLSPKPLLLIHGSDDEVLPDLCSRDIYRRARDPKEMRIYACRHGLDECREEVDRDLLEWLQRVLR
jgi:pimeloyl-ACP methyl ester carboxylesterase